MTISSAASQQSLGSGATSSSSKMYSIFLNYSPLQGRFSDSAPITSGIFFYSDAAGYANGVRYYKTSNTTGTHIGKLWSNSCVELATANLPRKYHQDGNKFRFCHLSKYLPKRTCISYYASNGNIAYDNSFFKDGIQYISGPLHTANNSGGVYFNGNACPSLADKFDNFAFTDVMFSMDYSTSNSTTEPSFISPRSSSLHPLCLPSSPPTFIDNTLVPSHQPSSLPTSISTATPSTMAPTIDPKHYSVNSFNVTHNLMNMNCSGFQSDLTAQNAFKLTVINSIIGTDAVLPQVDII